MTSRVYVMSKAILSRFANKHGFSLRCPVCTELILEGQEVRSTNSNINRKVYHAGCFESLFFEPPLEVTA